MIPGTSFPSLNSAHTHLMPNNDEDHSSCSNSFENRYLPSNSNKDIRMSMGFLSNTCTKPCSIPITSNCDSDVDSLTTTNTDATSDVDLDIDDKDPSFIAKKKAFIKSLTYPCPERGMLICKLCQTKIWGPNGRYHIEICPVLTPARQEREDGLILHSINGIRIYHEFFKRPKPLTPKPAKIPGFVMSNTVLRNNPFKAPTREQLKLGIKVGRKGFTRCLACNLELHAPNTRRHQALCPKRKGFSLKKPH